MVNSPSRNSGALGQRVEDLKSAGVDEADANEIAILELGATQEGFQSAGEQEELAAFRAKYKDIL